MPSPFSRSRVGALHLLPAIGFVLVACIDSPTLSTIDDVQAAPANLPAAGATDPAHPEMVFVPGIAIDVPVTSVPAPSNGQGDEGDGEGNGKGKGGGKKDAGPPPPPPPPPPTTPPGPSSPPTTHLEVAGFWIDVHEVTVDAFRACVVAGGCTAPAAGAGCTAAAGLGPHPVSCVTLEQARSYCAWQTKRLVRNDEWTAAAMGAEQRPYPWGTELPTADRLNACGTECAASAMYPASDGQARTAPVGTFPLGRTPEGVLDLAGNVAELVDGAGAIVRGGSFEDVDLASVRSLAQRGADAASPTVGFRCAADR